MARKPANAEPDFETTLAQLETIVTKLESGELPLEDALKELMKEERAGMVLRAKGIVECDNGEWIHFDYVPGEPEVRIGAAATTGMICVIGTGLKKDVIKEIFGL